MLQNSAYSEAQQCHYMGKDYFMGQHKEFIDLKNEYYDEDGKLVQTYRGYDFKHYASYYIPMRTEIIPARKNNHKTVLTVQVYELNPPLKDGFFSLQNIKNIH